MTALTGQSQRPKRSARKPHGFAVCPRACHLTLVLGSACVWHNVGTTGLSEPMRSGPDTRHANGWR